MKKNTNPQPRRRTQGLGKATNAAGKTVPSTAWTTRTSTESGTALRTPEDEHLTDLFMEHLLREGTPLADEDTFPVDYSDRDAIPAAAYRADDLAHRAVQALPAAFERTFEKMAGYPLDAKMASGFYDIILSKDQLTVGTLVVFLANVAGRADGLVDVSWLPEGFEDYRVDQVAVDEMDVLLTAYSHMERLAGR